MAAKKLHESTAARLALLGGAAAAVVVLDQLSKAWVRAALVPGKPVTLIPHVMDLSLVYNTGAAFSMGEGRGVLFVLICAVICAGCCVLVWRERDMPPALLAMLGCVCGGGIGNAIDRVMAGRVTDFFATTFMDFAVFNVADVFITCGVILAFILWYRWDAKRETDASSD